MDQKCVICKSATYHEHDELISSLRKQFWQMIPIRTFVWGNWSKAHDGTIEGPNYALLGCIRVQGEVMKSIIFHDHTTSHSPSNKYITLFLKAYIAKIESQPSYELDDELMEFYVSLISTTDTSPASSGMCYKTYLLDREQYTKVVLKEEQMMISQGTTGLQTWEASLRLADFFVEHPDIIRGMHVLELGAGCGLSGFTCAMLGASHVLTTDFNNDVLKLLEFNKGQNPEVSNKIQVAELDWEHVSECAYLADGVDVIIGADITYDPTVVPSLVNTLKTLLLSPQQVAYITATIRNEYTFELFLKLIDESGVLGKSVMNITESTMTALCHPNATADIRLVLITRK